MKFSLPQRPIHLIDWENRTQRMATIAVNTAVWLGDSNYPCKDGIATVTRLTNTQIIVESPNYHGLRRFRRGDGMPVGGGMFASYITGIATKQEIKQYEAAEAARKAKATRRENEYKRRENLRSELDDLFSEKGMFSDRGIYVRADENDLDKPVAFSVTISGLTAEEVRALAPKLDKALGGK